MSKNVRIYNLITKKINVIPAAELAPGMVEAEVAGIGRVWIAAAQVPDGNVKNAPFDPEIREFIRKNIQEPLAEVHPMTLDKWEDGFRRDNNPEREIGVWCRIATRFVKFSNSENLNRAQRQECFTVMLNCTTCPEDKVLEVVKLEALTRKQAQCVIEAFICAED